MSTRWVLSLWACAAVAVPGVTGAGERSLRVAAASGATLGEWSARVDRLLGSRELVTRLTRDGYEVRVLPAWHDFPSDDPKADTALMNERLQGYIDAMPDQYYWVHKRFKTRPAGMPAVY